jgi:hypothetical protein
MKQCSLKTTVPIWGMCAVFIALEIVLNAKEKQGKKLG